MSKKQHSKDSSGFIFDVQSNTVRAQGGSFENMKEKIGAVRAIVPNRSNTEIVLVLQHFDNCVDRTVQAFMEGNASEVLKEWTVTGKKKNKKKKPKPKIAPEPENPKKSGSEEEIWAKGGISINGVHENGAGPDSESLESLSEGPENPENTGTALGNGIPAFSTQSLPLPPSQSLRSGPGSPGGKKLGSSLEKSLKDLQRCSVALARFRALLREEMENSLRRMKQAFADIQSCLMDREVALLAEMDKVKAEAMDLLAQRQRRAEFLRKLTEAAPGMSEEQLLELRADIKHFVSERKFDEELGRAGRFGCDLAGLRGAIAAFGQVSHPKLSYSSRSRCGSGPTAPGSTSGSSGSALGLSGSGSSPPGLGSAPGPALGSSLGSAPGLGSSLGSPLGSALLGSALPGSALPGSSLGSSLGSFPGSSFPGSPEPKGTPLEPPELPRPGPNPQCSERSRKPGSSPRPQPQRPPGTPQNPPNPTNPPKNPSNPPQNPPNPGPRARSRRETPRRPRRSRPEGANS